MRNRYNAIMGQEVKLQLWWYDTLTRKKKELAEVTEVKIYSSSGYSESSCVATLVPIKADNKSEVVWNIPPGIAQQTYRDVWKVKAEAGGEAEEYRYSFYVRRPYVYATYFPREADFEFELIDPQLKANERKWLKIKITDKAGLVTDIPYARIQIVRVSDNEVVYSWRGMYMGDEYARLLFHAAKFGVGQYYAQLYVNCEYEIIYSPKLYFEIT